MGGKWWLVDGELPPKMRLQKMPVILSEPKRVGGPRPWYPHPSGLWPGVKCRVGVYLRERSFVSLKLAQDDKHFGGHARLDGNPQPTTHNPLNFLSRHPLNPCTRLSGPSSSSACLYPVCSTHRICISPRCSATTWCSSAVNPIYVWGTAAPGAKIDVFLASQKGSAQADSQGQWKIALPPMDAAGPFELKAVSGANTVQCKDVMIGDVWLIAGQSNVVLTLAATTDAAQAKAEPANPAVRVFKMPGNYSLDPTDTVSRKVPWDLLDPKRVSSYLSGVGYYFVRTLQPAAGVTVGLVQASAGGTQVEEWTPEAALKAAEPNNPLFAVRDKVRADLAADPNAKISVANAGAASMYNGTIHPLRYAKWKGVVWYQGEANSRSPRDYRPVLTAFVRSWRELFGDSELPLIIVQLPGFGLPKDDGWMRVQEAQRLTARELGLPLVVTIDQGSPTTIHPPNKAEVGRRVALAALQHVYKQDIEGSSPAPRDVTFTGDTATVEFDGFKGDLVLKGDAVKGFELAGDDKKFVPATAVIKGRSVLVQSAAVPQPKALRYLWTNFPEVVTLYSAAGLPAVPFRSTDAAALK